MTKDIVPEALAHFTGTEAYHAFSPVIRNAVITDGAKYLGDKAGAYWLFDVIASYLPRLARYGETFAVASITRHKNGRGGCIFRLTNGNDGVEAPLVEYAYQNVPYTDFPFAQLGEAFKLFIETGTVLDQNDQPKTVWVIELPSEH